MCFGVNFIVVLHCVRRLELECICTVQNAILMD